jgi:hypothetical protein
VHPASTPKECAVASSNRPLDECIEHCLDCHRQCQQSAMQHCLPVGGRHTEPEHFRLMLDCAEVCRSAAVLMMNDSPFHHALCGVCADLCERCAESCRTLDGMEDCAAACERCAGSCRQMAASGGRHARGRGSEHRPGL